MREEARMRKQELKDLQASYEGILENNYKATADYGLDGYTRGRRDVFQFIIKDLQDIIDRIDKYGF